jgi:hypothetical protein
MRPLAMRIASSAVRTDVASPSPFTRISAGSFARSR